MKRKHVWNNPKFPWQSDTGWHWVTLCDYANILLMFSPLNSVDTDTAVFQVIAGWRWVERGQTRRAGRRRKKLSAINGPNPVKPNLLNYITSRLNGRFGLEFFIGENLSTVIFLCWFQVHFTICTDISTFSCNSQSGKKAWMLWMFVLWGPAGTDIHDNDHFLGWMRGENLVRTEGPN